MEEITVPGRSGPGPLSYPSGPDDIVGSHPRIVTFHLVKLLMNDEKADMAPAYGTPQTPGN